MTLAVVFLQFFNIFLIITSMLVITALLLVPKYRGYWLWVIPVLLLLFDSLCFRVAYLIDAIDGISNPFVYSLWNEIVHTHDKLTILMYAVAIFVLTFKLTAQDFIVLKAILSWKKRRE